jgi:uncharacterized protein (TIGR00290 family)
MQDAKYDVGALLTTVNAASNRISMHGVRRALLEEQARSIGIDLHIAEVPEQPAMEDYEQVMKKSVLKLQEQGFSAAVFGDIFLEDLRLYREKQLKTIGVRCVFPLWKKNTHELMDEFLEAGFKAIIVCVNEQYLDKSFCGRLLDRSLINDLPPNVDICGENGEYHSFVFDGPLFSRPISFHKGEIVRKTYPAPVIVEPSATDAGIPEYGFYFCDLY